MSNNNFEVIHGKIQSTALKDRDIEKAAAVYKIYDYAAGVMAANHGDASVTKENNGDYTIALSCELPTTYGLRP